LKKQKKLGIKNKSNNQARTKLTSKHLNEEDLLQTNVSKQQINSSSNFIVTVSDDDQEEVNVVEINNNDNTIETDENDSNKTVYITSTLNDALIQNDVLNNNFKLEAMQSLAKRSLNSISEDDISCSLQSFLLKFTSPEFLTGNNKFGCENCTRSSYRKLNYNNANCVPKDFKTIYTQAVKQYLICELPAILTIHLKRFQQHGFRLEKVNKHVNFPLGKTFLKFY
jgi:ubiquitin carboxyl-terminal hydrolase 16/45